MPIASLSLVALDCPDPLSLAEFYRGILGGEIEVEGHDWVQLNLDAGCDLAFQLSPDHQPTQWPDGPPQQLHLDFDVTDLHAAERAVVALGAVKASLQTEPTKWLVFLDPAGHPFCLVQR
jgi:catechol 2,3-dioxygenase-like lactoylglutathione lyase family enzyme